MTRNWKTYIGRTILAGAVLALTGCGKRIEICNNGTTHEWGKWEDVWLRPEHGYMKQIRHCEKCGVAQMGMHE